MEEWLTDYRAKLMKKCKVLLKVTLLIMISAKYLFF